MERTRAFSRANYTPTDLLPSGGAGQVARQFSQALGHERFRRIPVHLDKRQRLGPAFLTWDHLANRARPASASATPASPTATPAKNCHDRMNGRPVIEA
jgi:hypothetical protein